MLKTKFDSKEELGIYISEQKLRQEKGYLTHSERETLKQLITNPNNFIQKEKTKPYKSIITDLLELKKPCLEVSKEDNIGSIIQDLKDTLSYYYQKALGLSANQIGYNKKITYCKIPKYNDKTKKTELAEIILINPKIIEKDRLVKIQNEGCLSFPGINLITARYVFITVEFYNEKFELQIASFQDLESFVIQHEIAHLEGKTIFDFKWRRK